MSWRETYQLWENFNDLEMELKNELKSLKDDSDTLEDAFYAPLEFGTAGMRGIIGAGVNRMNAYTVR